jgi:hypothetical protein
MNEYYLECNSGWTALINELIEKLTEAGWDGQVDQIKEKFGYLRFYISNGDEKLWAIISEYENKSGTICEMCGKPGKLRQGVWWKTRCDECQAEHEKK